MTQNEHVNALCNGTDGDAISGRNDTEVYVVVYFEVASSSSFQEIQNKVITTTVIRSVDDRTYCVRYAFTHLGLWRKLLRLFTASLQSQKMPYQTCSIDIFVDLQLFGCNLELTETLWVEDGSTY